MCAAEGSCRSARSRAQRQRDVRHGLVLRTSRLHLLDKNIAPADLTAVRLELDRAAIRDRLFAVVVVLHHGVIDDALVVEPHADAVADDDDPEMIPLAER